jgi:pyridoxal phosphate enzyme (YggS family)
MGASGEGSLAKQALGKESLHAALRSVRTNVEEACRRTGRRSEDVLLVAATKLVPLETVRLARDAGIEHFGENYANELAVKAASLQATTPVTWHFLGTLQTGNAGSVADHADFIHSAEPGRAFQRIARRASRLGRSVACLIQVDFTGRRQGMSPEAIAPFLETVQNLPGVRVIGLMTMPPWSGDAEATRPYFARLRKTRDDLQKDWPELRELSMGMSGDYQVAVEEGATMLRIGTALFGERPRRAPEGAGRGSRGAKET